MPVGNGRPVIAAIILSIIAHLLLAGALVVLSSVSDSLMGRFFEEPADTVIVDVIELPPDTAPAKSPQRPSFYSDRNRSVVKETWPQTQRDKTITTVVPAPVYPGQRPSAASSASTGADSSAGHLASAVTKPPSVKTHERSDLADAGLAPPAKSGQPVSGVKPSSTGEEAASAVDTAVKARPSLFPSKERLGELTKRYVAEAPKGETGKVLSLNTSEIRYQKYLIGMKNKIENLWEYPPVAVRNGWQGGLKINFTIKRDGTVSEITLVKSSNNPVLDDAAITVLRLASPFAPFPDDFEVEEITIKGEFVYVFARPPGR